MATGGLIKNFSPAATRDPPSPPRIDLGVIEITNSEPDELDNGDLSWTGLKKKAAAPRRDTVKEDSGPVDADVDVPIAQAGPSTSPPTPDPFPEVPIICIQPEGDPQMTQEPDMDPYSKHLALILEVIPDVLPEHAMELIKKHYPTYNDRVTERVLQDIFDDPSYPKVENDVTGKGKGKGKASWMEDMSEGPPSTINFASVDRPKPTGKDYRRLALTQLCGDFPYIPVSHIRRVLALNNELYTPTHIQLTAEMESDAPPFTVKAIKTKISVGKERVREMRDEDFEEERAWLLTRDVSEIREVLVAELGSRASGGSGTSLTDPVVLPEEGRLGCERCFSPAPFHSMIQCPDAHLFCTECIAAHASNLLGEHNFKIVCMDKSGCKLPFSESELKRFLTPELLSLYEKVKQTKEIKIARLEGLEECPYCEFKVVFDDPDERLFRCQNEECGVVTCRECKKPDHLPKPCVGAQEAPQQRGEELERHREDNWLHPRRLLQKKWNIAGKFAGNKRNRSPAALPDNPINPLPRLPDNPINPLPRLQENRARDSRMDPVDRGRVDEWRRGIPSLRTGRAWD